MKVSVIGTGYVGLAVGAGLASLGHEVICVDTDVEKIRLIGKGISPIYEKGLGELLKEVLRNQSFSVTVDLVPTVLNSEITFICVGTPTTADGDIDLSQIKTVSVQIGEALRQKKDYHVVVVKSTVVPRTCSEVVLPIIEETSGKVSGEFGLCMNPEFLREGNAVEDFLNPDRIVIGGLDKRSGDILTEVYASFDVPVLRTSLETAEMIKYANNALLGTLISFSNEIANLCSSIGGTDAVDVMKGVHLDKRISPIMPDGERVVPHFTTYLEAGCGFGGSCLPKDIKALSAYGTKVGSPMRLLEVVTELNQERPEKVITLLKRHFPVLHDVPVAVLGLAFKPGTDDIRESPAVPIIRALLNQGAKVKAYDPMAKHNAQKLFVDRDVTFCDDLAQAIDNVQAVLLVTRWKEFERIPELLSHRGESPLVIDGRRMLSKHSVARYDGIGL
jgi:UDPglucose 6-dehydrogenase